MQIPGGCAKGYFTKSRGPDKAEQGVVDEVYFRDREAFFPLPEADSFLNGGTEAWAILLRVKPKTGE